MSEETKSIIYLYDQRQSPWVSTFNDLVSFGSLVATAIALNTLMPPSGWINAAVSICWILWLIGKAQIRQKRLDPASAIAWIRSEFPDAEIAA